MHVYGLMYVYIFLCMYVNNQATDNANWYTVATALFFLWFKPQLYPSGCDVKLFFLFFGWSLSHLSVYVYYHLLTLSVDADLNTCNIL